jgi:DNA modification methylase
MFKSELSKIVYVNPKELVYNEELKSIYDYPKNYLEIKENVKFFGLIQPIIANKKTKEVISGNLRLQVAIELKFKKVPVIFCDVLPNDLIKLSISSNIHREKSLMDRYNEMLLIESYFSISQGGRSDKNPQLKEESLLKKKLMTIIPTYTLNQIKRAKILLTKLKTQNVSEVLVKDIIKIDKGDFSLNAYIKKLESRDEEETFRKNVPEFYEIHEEGFIVYNDEGFTKPLEKNKSVSTIICSPPYYKMRKYGFDSNELGREETKEEYIKNLITHFSECHRILKDDGSLFVNIGEGVNGDGYQGVIHSFIVEMLKTNLYTLNDEIIWSKVNPVYTEGNRFVRSHEYVFHFVKSNNIGFKYNSSVYPFIKDEKSKCVYGADKLHPKILSFFELRDNTFYTNVANTGELRRLSHKENLPMEHTATFPLSVPALLILLTTDEGDIVMDVFNGSGVTGEACILLKRKYIGYEKYSSYVKATEVRINNMAA